MPLPSKRKDEKRSDFVSRCVSFMARKGEGESAEQRVAICNSRYTQARANELMGPDAPKIYKDDQTCDECDTEPCCCDDMEEEDEDE